jgi:hypothetical protein
MRATLLLGVAALSLGACKLDRTPDASADQAQLTAGAPFQLGLAPSFDSLPYAEPVPVSYAPQPVAYDYWNDAYDANQTYYNQPPSYFNYAGATPLVWGQQYQQPQQSLTDTLKNFAITRIVESLVGGGQREYYYQPNQTNPYFVRDPQYAYAFDDGRLISAYDPYGQTLGQQLLMQQAPTVARYLLRADALRDAALQTRLIPLDQQVWDTQRVVLINQLDDNDGWKKTWVPGANRSPVAIQRLAEVRARKEARDEAHAAWKATRDKGESKAAWSDRTKADVKASARMDKDHGKAKADDKPVKKAEVAKGSGKAKGGKDDRGHADDHGGGNGKKG